MTIEQAATMEGLRQQRDELVAALREYLAAADYSALGINDVRAMLRYAAADSAARALLAKIEQ
ncbi:MAG: hypothetical protein KGH75_06065 [Rhodospirillales bacterium]|nr:hypothetical protein [Rhodospirillales bacterium]